jgi:hypothetical protein
MPAMATLLSAARSVLQAEQNCVASYQIGKLGAILDVAALCSSSR